MSQDNTGVESEFYIGELKTDEDGRNTKTDFLGELGLFECDEEAVPNWDDCINRDVSEEIQDDVRLFFYLVVCYKFYGRFRMLAVVRS